MNDQPFGDLNSQYTDQVRNGCQELRDRYEIRQTWDHIIATMALRIRQSLKLKEILQTTADEVQKLLKCDRVLLYEIDPNGNGSIVVEALEDEKWSLEGCIVEDTCFIELGKSLYSEREYSAIANISTADLVPCYQEFLNNLQVQANLVIPLFQESDLWGLLIAHHCTEPRVWQQPEIEGLQQIAIQVGIALNQANLIAQLQKTKAELQQQVVTRTAQLSQLNQQLKQRNQALQNAVVGISQLDPQGRYTNVNPAYARICGCQPEDLIGKPWQQTVHPDDIPLLEEKYQIMLHRGRVETQARGVRGDGSVFYKQVMMIADYSAQGVLLGHHCFIKDITQEKQAQIALQQKTEELDRFFSVTLDLLSIADTNGRFVRLNSQWEKTLGYPMAQLEGQQFIDYVHPDDRQNTLQAIENLSDGQQVINFVNRYRCQDGSYRWLEWRSVPVGDRIYSAARDITRRQQAEAQLQNLSTRLSLALEAGKIGTWDWDLKDTVNWDQRMYEIFGLQHLQRKAVYQDWADLIHRDDITELESAMEAAIAKDGFFNVEFRIVRPDGLQRWLTGAAIVQRQSDGQPVRMTGINYDITDRKQAELSLKYSEAKYRTIIETTLEGVWVLDPTDKTSFVNQQMAEMLGYSVTDMLGVAFLAFIDPEESAIAQIYLKQRHQGVSDRHRVKLRHHDRSVVSAIISSTPLFDDQRQYQGCIKLVTDITQIVQIQEALQTSEAQLASVLNSSLDGIMAFCSLRNETGEIVDFIWLLSNPTACEMVGRSPEQLIGKQLLEEMPGNKTDGLFDAYVQVVESGEPFKYEFYYQHDGIDCWFENTAVKLGDGFAVTFRNVTRTKESEKALQQLNQQLEQRLDDLKLRHQEMVILGEINEFLQACTTVDEAYEAIAYLVEPLFPHCSGGLFITSSPNRIENVARWGSDFHSAVDFDPKHCWGLRRGRPYEVGNQRSGPRCQHIQQTTELAVTLCIPMMAQGETLGLFYLATKTAAALPEPKQQLARTVSEQLSLAIANLNLRETLQNQSIRDPLTGLFNRRYLEESFNQQILRAQPSQHPIGLIMLDIDHFKQFNDTYGHDAGDYVLQVVAEVLKTSVRGSDIACRYGGEEMTLIMPELSLEATSSRAEAIRTAISQLRLNYNGQKLNILTASIGIACFPQHGTTPTAVIKAADQALYRAKANGRNCAIVATLS